MANDKSEKAAPEFSLRSPIENSVTTVRLNKSLGGGTLLINRGTAEIKSPKSAYNGLKVATSDDLKKVYDNAPEFAKMINAPEGYTAPWAKKK